jgi:glucose/arabinose dehydrogenase
MSLFEAQVDRPGFISRHKGLAIGAGVTLAAIVVLATGPFGLSLNRTEDQRIRIVRVAEGLSFPWGLAFLPNGDMLVTERPGRLRIIRNGTLQTEPVAGAPNVVVKAQAGLMDIALHPRFAENGFVYLTYSKPGRGDSPALMRARFDGTKLTDAQDIFVADAWSESGGNTGSRIVFGKDGMIYMSVGDRHLPKMAQYLGNHAGKILRLRDDGTVPDDNPFIGQAGVRPEIFTYGNRNPQGLAIDPNTGAIFENEHGPRGGDEINLLQAGRNYGWPVITYGINYDGTIITNEKARPGMEQPLVYWVPSIGPSGMAVYTGDRFPRWKGNLFVGAMAGTHLRRVVLDGTRVVHEERILHALHVRIRDVRQGPDGLLYLLTDDEPGSVLKIEPAD